MALRLTRGHGVVQETAKERKGNAAAILRVHISSFELKSGPLDIFPPFWEE